MRQFTLSLQEKTQRPVAHLKNFYGLDAMLDTGALFPIWVAEEETLAELGGILLNDCVKFGGFGGMTTGKLYKLPIFRVGELMFPEFHIIACQIALPCQVILSATMFRNLVYEIDDFNHKLNVTIPDTQSEVRNFLIWDSDGCLHVACHSAE